MRFIPLDDYEGWLELDSGTVYRVCEHGENSYHLRVLGADGEEYSIGGVSIEDAGDEPDAKAIATKLLSLLRQQGMYAVSF